MRHQYISKLLPLWLFLALGGSAVAVQNNWTGAGGDMLWTNSANWSLGVLPDSTQDVFIGDTDTNAVILNAAAQAGTFSLGSTQGMGVLTISGGALDCVDTGLIGSNAVLNLAGDLSSSNSFTIAGAFDWSSGSFVVTNSTMISPSGNWTIRATATCNLNGSVVNNGSVACFATNIHGLYRLDPFNQVIGCQITNNHVFTINTNLTFSADWYYNSVFFNSGTLLVPAGNSNLMLTTDAYFRNAGTVRVETNSSLTIRQSRAETLMLRSGTVFEGEGLTRLTDGSGSVALDILFTSGNITVNGTVELGGGRGYGSAGVGLGDYNDPVTLWSGPGLLRWPAGALINFTFAPGFHVETIGTSDKQFAGTCTNHGTIRWTSNASFSKASYPPEANFYTDGEIVLEDFCVLAGPFMNAGTIRVPAEHGAATLILGPAFENTGTLLAETNATLNLQPNQGDGVFYQGTIFDGAGVVNFPEGADFFGFAGVGTMVVNGTVEIENGNVRLDGTWTGPGLLRWLGGRLGPSTFGTNFNVEIGGSIRKKLDGVCTNLGTIRWTSSIGAFPDTVLDNRGLALLETGLSFDELSLLNEGTIKVPADLGTITLTSFPVVHNSGMLEIETNSILEFSGFLNLTEGAVINGPGIFRWAGPVDSFNTVSGNIAVNGMMELAGAQLAGGSWSGTGLFRWLSGTFGDFTVAPGFHVEVSGEDTKKLGGACTNLGEFHVQGSGPIPSGAFSEITFNNSALVTVDSDWSWNAGTFRNLAGGTFRQASGQTSFDQYYNNGTIELTGILNVADTFQQESTGGCKLSLNSDPSGTQVQGRFVHLDGALTAAFADGFTPIDGSLFTVVSYSALWNAFSNVTLPPLADGLNWRVSYQPDMVNLIVGSPSSLTNAVVLSNGSFQFTLTGAAGGNYEIQASTNLVDWVTLTNAPFSGSATFNDTTATNFTRRFYRGVLE